jgi:hypothetical protein
MKIIKWTALTILILTLVGFLFRGWFYRNLVTYKSTGARTSYTVKDVKLASSINASADEQVQPHIEEVIELALSITSEQLNFTAEKNDTDPNKLIVSQTANCVGYAAFFATTCNYLLVKHKLADTWIAKPQVGQLHFLDINIHQYISTPFFADHDFVTIENKTRGQIFAVDPTVSDYLDIDLVTYDK